MNSGGTYFCSYVFPVSNFIRRKENYGERTVKSLYEKLVEKKINFEASGIKMFVSENPFCCVVITPLMLRAHSMHFSSEIVFVDSSGSCDQMGNSITFFFGATKVGGVPLGCLIHSHQTQEVYEFCFQKFREVLGSDGFAGKGAPSVFMTDDSVAEINALHTVFPKSTTLLCTFHVMQAVWRWLWDQSHEIKKADRRSLMQQFRDILYAKNIIDCNLFKEELCSSQLSAKYKLFLNYFEDMWKRNSEWCHCFRAGMTTRGHNTNNIVEASIRIFKDVVLKRCRAFNSVSLVDFITYSMEQFYQQKLISSANSRRITLQIYFKKFSNKCTNLVATKVNDFEYNINSALDEHLLYTVNIQTEQCDCPDGVGGKFCKHLCAVYNSGVNLLHAPDLNFHDRVELATLALGTGIDNSFFMGMEENVNIVNDGNNKNNNEFSKPMETNNIVDPTSREMLENTLNDSDFSAEYQVQLTNLKLNLNKFYNFAEVNQSKFMLQHICNLNKKIENIENIESFSNICTGICNFRKTRKIKVQPTSIARRTNRNLHAGARVIQAGRPSKLEVLRKKKKRSKKMRSLSKNIDLNQTNAIGHGSSH